MTVTRSYKSFQINFNSFYFIIKLAQACQREVRKSALLSQKLVKDVPGRARRLTKEMMLYWKRYEKVEKEHRRRAEKEAQEQLRLDIELREVMLSFLFL